MDRGVETASFNGNMFRQAFAETFRNEDGSKSRAHGVFDANEDGVRGEPLDVRCLVG